MKVSEIITEELIKSLNEFYTVIDNIIMLSTEELKKIYPEIEKYKTEVQKWL